jgi:hypothetical protein
VTQLVIENGNTLPTLIDRAAKALMNARSSAEVLEARDLASVAYDMAKKAARLAKAKQAHDEVIAAAYHAQANALEIEAGAKRRLADEYDAAQERGEVATRESTLRRGPDIPEENNGKSTISNLGLTSKDIYEARQLRDAEREDPGIIRRTLDERIERGEEPTKAAIREAVIHAATQGIRGTNPMSRRRPMETESDPQFEAMLVVAGNCRDILARAGSFAPEYIIGGFVDDGMRERNLTTIRRCRDFLTAILETADVEHEACPVS